MRRRANVLSGLSIDRAAGLRTNPERLAEAWRRAETRVLPVWRSKHFVVSEELSRVAFVGPERFPGFEEAILLGEGDGAVYFAVDVSHVEQPLAELGLDELHTVLGLREVASLLPQAEGALLAYANGMSSWHQRHRFCSVCGCETVSAQAGHVRECTACGEIHFPRTDPAVIMLVTRDDECLLGRQAAWPEKVHSTLAGFVEPGESLEEAVAREVYEEAGIKVEDVQYHSSQPWPFPGSLMLGFTAVATTRDIVLQTEELEAARWFRADELREQEVVKLPSEISIARRLIEDWLEG
jgi:NAD+ diphosphatase